MKRFVTLILFTITFISLFPLVAPACSRMEPLTVEQLAGISDDPTGFQSGQITGVYQLETLALVPDMGLRKGAAATVVARYWGEPPRELGIQVDGGEWFLGLLWHTDCGPDPLPPAGESGYGFQIEGDSGRFVAVQMVDGPWYAPGTMHGELNAEQVAALDQRYGPHRVLEISAADSFRGLVAVWWPNALLLAGVAGGVYLLVRRYKRRRSVPEGVKGMG